MGLWVILSLLVLPECVSDSIIGQKAFKFFSGLILIISEGPSTQFKQILGLLWPITDNIKLVVGLGGPLDISSCVIMCFRRYNWVKYWPTRHFRAQFYQFYV